MTALPPHRHGDPTRPARDPARTLRRFALAAAVLLIVGFGAGALFGRVDPQRAARLVVSEFTEVEDGPADAPGPDPAFPATGPQRGDPACGRIDTPLDPGDQVATIAAGVVLVQHRTDLTPEQVAYLDELAGRDRVAVAPTDALEEDGPVVVATSWRHRMSLDRVDRELLEAFVTGHVDRAPAVTACPRTR
ncbi:DUF3105 domain-containing protein [Nitriliruptor alkaliphilus]|uniref:DUF3105 domain-containing protein n=1 Tax=Nitriliruptor alkaliphilus TaxID=427918 RepID=UPI00147024B4|nr:DUF3105 domain-containing protein [Nitriliruptor alkaliphilus]